MKRVLCHYGILWVIFLLYSCITVFISGKVSSILGLNSNLLLWGIGILIFCATFIMLSRNSHDVKLPSHFGILFLGITILWMAMTFVAELDLYPYSTVNFPRHTAPHLFYFVFVTLVTVILGICVLFLQKKNVRSHTGLNCLDVVIGISVIILTFCLLYAPNVFLCEGAGLYHVHAYENSIFNVANLVPYDEVNSSIYGHYGLLYLLPVQVLSLFFNLGKSVSLCVALMGALTYIALFFVAKKLFGHGIFLWLTMLCALYPITVVYRTGEYFQVYPHRVLFPLLILWACLYDKGSQKMGMIQDLLVVLSLIWNLEVGLACAAAVAANNVFKEIYRRGWRTRVIFSAVLKNFMRCIILFLLSYLTVNGYNLIVGGGWNDIRTFIYPIASSYNIDKLRVALNSVFSEWFVLECIFLLGVAIGIEWLIHSRRDHEQRVWLIESLFQISVLGIFLMPYYMNRAVVANISIVYLEGILAVMIFLKFCTERLGADKWSIRGGTGIWVSILLTVSICLCEIALSVGENVAVYRRSIWNTESVEKAVAELQADQDTGLIEEDIIAFGEGVPELFAYADMKTNCYITDWSDMNQYSIDAVLQQLSEGRQVLMEQSISQESILHVIENMTLVKTYNIGEYSYGLYIDPE